MNTFAPLDFQKKAVESLTEIFTALWKQRSQQLPIVFTSPTGSDSWFNYICHYSNMARKE